MNGEQTPNMETSYSGYGNTGKQEAPSSPELEAASEKLDRAVAEFVQAGNEFLEAGGDQMELMRRFQMAVMPQG